MIGKVLQALIEVIGSHPEFNGPLGDAFKRHGVDLKGPGYTMIMCRDIGTAYTTPTFLLRDGQGWIARAGIAIMGGTNMKDADLERLSPFDKEWHDNFAEGRGAKPLEAIEAMHEDRRSIADSIFAE